MSITLTNGKTLTYQQWQSLNDTQKAELAAFMGYGSAQFVDKALSAGEQLQSGLNPPAQGGGTQSTTLPDLTAPDWHMITPESLLAYRQRSLVERRRFGMAALRVRDRS